jgi:hypothetical protein
MWLDDVPQMTVLCEKLFQISENVVRTVTR